MPDEAPVPTRSQARRIIGSLAVFWACWGVGVGVGLEREGGVLLIPVGLVAIFIMYATVYDTYRAETGLTGWQLLLFPSFNRYRRRVRSRATWNLLRLSWWRATLRASEWPMRLVATLLVGLLVLDLVLAAVLLPRW